GLVVSNHGGPQLDGVSASLRALPEGAAAGKGGSEILMEGGGRRRAALRNALCLGALAVFGGRASPCGPGGAREDGVARAIEILRTDLVRTLKLLGCHSVAKLDRSYIQVNF